MSQNDLHELASQRDALEWHLNRIGCRDVEIKVDHYQILGFVILPSGEYATLISSDFRYWEHSKRINVLYVPSYQSFAYDSKRNCELGDYETLLKLLAADSDTPYLSEPSPDSATTSFNEPSLKSDSQLQLF
jgi:hypothetical protein